MILGEGRLSGRNGYRTEGRFTLTRGPGDEILFETSDNFFFGNSSGGGTPAPGFAFYRGGPTDDPNLTVEPVAQATDFLRIADTPVAVSGRQAGQVPANIDIEQFDTLFGWLGRKVPDSPLSGEACREALEA
ncbi:MAG: hypothetical protein AAF713_21470 [Pseudomonadota bacterium]